MPNILSTDAAIHSATDLIHALQNPVPSNPLFTVVNTHNYSLIYLAKIFDKENSPARPPRVVQTGQHQLIIEKVSK